MKKIILCFMFMLAMCVSTEAAQYINYEKLSMGGYISKQAAEVNGELKPQGLFGVTDKNGNVKLPFEYCNITETGDGYLFAVRKEEGGLYGVVDSNNNIVFDYKFEYVFRNYFEGELYGIAEQNGRKKCYLIRGRREHEIGTVESDEIIERDSLSGKRKKAERRITVNDENVITFGNVLGVTDENGNVILPFEFGDIEEINNGKQYKARKKDGLNCWGLFDNNGNLIVTYKYNDIFMYKGECYGEICDYKNKLRYFYKIENGKETLVNKTTLHEYIGERFSGGNRMAAENGIDPPFGVVDPLGRVVLPFEYYDILLLNGGEKFIVNREEEGLYGIVDKNNNKVVDYKYNFILTHNKTIYGAIERDGKVDYYKIEEDGEHFFKTLDGYVFNSAKGVLGYYVKTDNENKNLNKKYGTVDDELNVIIEPQYDNEIVFAYDDYAFVYKGSTDAYIDGKYGNVVYSGGEYFSIGKDGKKRTVKNERPTVYVETEDAVRLGRLQAVLEAVEIPVNVMAIGCGLWLIRYVVKRKMRKRQ